MNDKYKTIEERIELADKSYHSLKNRYHYVSFKNANTVLELNNGKDKNGDTIHIMNNLKNGIIFFSFPSQFNDPHEFELTLSANDWAEFILWENSLIERFVESGTDLHTFVNTLSDEEQNKCKKRENELRKLGNGICKKHKDEFGIFCLAPSPYDSYFWDEYCNKGNGICCEYCVDNILNDSAVNKTFIKKVIYSDEPLKYLPEYVTLPIPQVLKKRLPKDLAKRMGKNSEGQKEIVHKMMCKKSSQWKNERENRLIIKILNENKEKQASREVPAIPEKIFIGYSVSEDIKSYFRIFCRERNIQLHEITKEECYNFC